MKWIKHLLSLPGKYQNRKEIGKEPTDPEKRRILFERAKEGSSFDKYAYGAYCLNGYGGEVNSGHAEYWLNLAANEGIVDAQSLLGESYLFGDVLKKDLGKSKYWLVIASTNEDANATRLLEEYFS
ncbi:MAG: hypothetical protein OQJ89_13160 [Kangiellaceae bacterium]|nr:hypothetical protein [Kangiellaceae bacterium]MCW9017913.1 hypothetical protein [Kangiellaceae bacterium]